MTDFRLPNRRSVLLGSAALATAAALPASLRAAAPKQGVLRPRVYRFPLGDFEVTTILDGVVQGDGPHPIFGADQFPEDVAALAEENFLPPTRFENGFTVTLVNTGESLILFDSGNGAGRRPNAGLLLERLGAAGVEAGQIDTVVLTHFHPDHIGGLMEEGAPAFPNASYVFGQAEYDFWSPAERAEADATARVGKLVQSNVVPFAEKARFIKGGDAVVSGIDAVESFGHTPGHLAYHVESGGERLMITGDVANHYVMSLQRPDWHVAFDMDKEAAAATRKAIFGMIASDRIPFVGYHMPAPAVGFVEAMGEGFRYVPATYQLNL